MKDCPLQNILEKRAKAYEETLKHENEKEIFRIKTIFGCSDDFRECNSYMQKKCWEEIEKEKN